MSALLEFLPLPQVRRSLARTVLSAATLLGVASPAWALLPIESWQEPQGTKVWLIQNPSLPMVDIRVEFDAGDRRDPATQAGLASAAAGMMSKGVRSLGEQPAMDENALGEAWADLGANLELSSSNDAFGMSLRSLTEPALLNQAVALAARQLGQPSWPEAIWQRERERWSAAIRESLTRPSTVAGQTFSELVYGDHPYGNTTRPETLARIGVSDLKSWHQRHLQACGAKVSIVGAVERAQASALVQALLAHLPAPARCEALPALPEVKPLAQAIERRIPWESAQAQVLIGQPGYARKDPDTFALMVGNHILGGGGFVSRLMEQVREQRGLSYSIYSYFSPAWQPGPFTIGLQTRSDQAEQALQVVREVVQRFVKEGPTQEELRAAKDNLTGSFALRIDSNAKLLANLAMMARYEMPLDYLENWSAQVEAVSVEQVQQAIARKLHPDRMVTVVVGGSQP